MKKLCVMLAGIVVLSGCTADLQASVVFEENWEDLVTEFRWGRRASFDQDEMMMVFSEWADEYEKKRAKLMRLDEKEELQGMTVILGQNLEANINEMEVALKNLQEIEDLQEDNKRLLRPVCAAQKTRVSCGL